MKMHELMPKSGRKSFNHTAIVQIDENGDETLISYCVPIVKNCKDGRIIRLWGGWSATTGAHIKAFCNLSKAEFMALPVESAS